VGGQIRINDQIMSTIAGDLVTTTASTATSINCAGQSQLIADGKLDAAETGQTGDYHLEDRTRYRIQDTESIQSLWSNDAWTETGHNFTVDHEAHDAWVYNQTVNLPKNSDTIITNNPDGSTTSQIIRLGQDQSTVTSGGGYDYHLTQSGTPTDFVFSLNHTSQSQSGKHDTGTWQAADGSSGATYDNLGSETKNSRANLSGRVQNGSVYYTGIDVYQTRNTSTNNTGSGFALGSTTSSHTVGSTQTTESRGGNSGSWYGSKLESGNSTTNYTTVSGTMGQPFSGMTQTGFYTTTQYGTAAQTGITGMYGYGQTGTGGTTFGTLSVGNTITPPEPLDLPIIPGMPNYRTPGGDLGNPPLVDGPIRDNSISPYLIRSGNSTETRGKYTEDYLKIKIGTAGDEIGTQIKNLLNDIDREWGALSEEKKQKLQDILGSPVNGWIAWDCLELNHENPMIAFRNSIPGTILDKTVTVNGRVYHAGEVNYIVYGRICRLITDWNVSKRNTIEKRSQREHLQELERINGLSNMLTLIASYRMARKFGGVFGQTNIRARQHWALAGWNHGEFPWENWVAQDSLKFNTGQKILRGEEYKSFITAEFGKKFFSDEIVFSSRGGPK